VGVGVWIFLGESGFGVGDLEWEFGETWGTGNIPIPAKSLE